MRVQNRPPYFATKAFEAVGTSLKNQAGIGLHTVMPNTRPFRAEGKPVHLRP